MTTCARPRGGAASNYPFLTLYERAETGLATGWSDWQVRSYCRQLVEMEYLYATINGNGRPCVYSLARVEEIGRDGLRGLTDVAELRQRLVHASSV